jgi:hypothetical protein
MDAMAFLDIPAGQDEVTRADFIQWSDKYIRFPCQEQLAGVDLYGARCSMLHAYGAVSRLSSAGKCRLIGYIDKSIPEVRYNPSGDKELVVVSITALKDAFFKGIDEFLVSAFADKNKAPIVEKRLRSFFQILPTRKPA